MAHMEKRLYRSRDERMVAGVCGGLAEYFDLDPTIVRVAAVFLAFVTSGGAGIAYLVMAVAVPERPAEGGPAVAGAAPAAYVPTEEAAVMNEPDPVPDRTAEAPAPPVAPPPEAPYAPPVTPPPAQPPYAPPAATYAPPVAPSAPRERHRGLWWGLALIIVGAALLLSQFVPGLDIWRLWPLVIVAIGISSIVKGVRR